MKRILMIAALGGLVAAGTCAVAQTQQEDQTQQSSQTMKSDNSTENSGNKNETMKQCMARQKATNSGLTHMQMQTTCKNEMKVNKTHKAGNDLATGPQAGDKQPRDQQQ